MYASRHTTTTTTTTTSTTSTTNWAIISIIILAVVQQSEGQQAGQPREQPTHGLCEPITVRVCQDIGYNSTIMPNILNHEKQDQAGMDVAVFFPLVKVNCSPQFKVFICSLYIPVCTILSQPIPPCRSVCIAARDGCSSLMSKFGFAWPDHMACERFVDPPQLCVGPNITNSGQTNQGVHTVPPHVSVPAITSRRPPIVRPDTVQPYIPGQGDPGFQDQLNLSRYDIKLDCPAEWVMNPKRKYQLTISDSVAVDNCGLPCHGVLYNSDEEKFARIWIGVWALLCLISTLFTVLTFLIDMGRFRYPERPIIFLSGCYFVVSLCYVVGFVLEDKVACLNADGKYCPQEDVKCGSPIVTQGTKNEGCTILFMLTYFFTMASSIWWVILTMTWVLAAGLKWGHEAIESNSQYFHLAAWAVPAVKTITIIALGSIDGDILSGVCFTGLSSKTALIGYVIVPLIVYLTLGTIFLVAGFVSLFNIRTVMKHGGTKTNKLEKLMVRIGIFSVLYTVPAVIVIACNIYELLYRESWMEQYRWVLCRHPLYKADISCPTVIPPTSQAHSGPDFMWFIFKYLSYLVVGITSGFWIWSNKTVSSWAAFFNKICCCVRSVAAPREAAV